MSLKGPVDADEHSQNNKLHKAFIFSLLYNFQAALRGTRGSLVTGVTSVSCYVTWIFNSQLTPGVTTDSGSVSFLNFN